MARLFDSRKSRSRQKQLIKPDSLEIVDLSEDGRGVGRHLNKVVFVEGALPGETVEVSHFRNHPKYCEAQLKRLTVSSPDRVDPFCSHFDSCGGCQLQHLAPQIDLKQKRLEAHYEKNFSDNAPKWLDPVESKPQEYRSRARFVVDGDNQLSMRQKRSDSLVAISRCAILVPALAEVFEQLQRVLIQQPNKLGISHVELIDGEPRPALIVRHLKPLADQLLDTLNGVFKDRADVYFQPEKHGKLTDFSGVPIAPELSFGVSGSNLHFHPQDFTQVNREVNQKMVDIALDWLDIAPGDHVIDLFCGIGNFSIPILLQGASILGVEGSAEMASRAMQNAQNAGLNNFEFVAANLEDPDSLNQVRKKPCDKLLLDPPRAGAKQVCTNLVELPVPSLVYVSCNPATLARDAEILINGGYRWECIRLMDMFPQTTHVESISFFSFKQ